MRRETVAAPVSNFQKLKERATPGRGGSPPGLPVFSGVEAVLAVADFAAAVAFFTQKLGFAVDFSYGDPPFYGVVERDRARICLRLVHEPVFVGDIRRREELLSAAITLAGASAVDDLFRGYQAAGVDFHQALTTQPWGARTFIVSDPDGNLILFAGPGG
ncbi:VOC family protein [Rhizobium alarense]|uniref:VOC family protein n=1 Tax=Rhizobium alarense TaxID=2846851 RepID=UPI0038B68674